MPRLVGLCARAVVFVAAGIAAWTGALAAEPLPGLIAHLPPTVDASGIVFSYLRRAGEYEQDFAARVLVSDFDADLLAGLAKPETGSRVTGVDFVRVGAVLQAGSPTAGILLIAGAPGFGDAAAAVLSARGYKLQGDPGRPVCAYTDPNDLDENRPDIAIDDPFASGGGRAYCLAALGERVIVAPDRRAMREAVARHTTQPACPVCKTFATMFAAAATSRGGKGEIVSALGSTLAAHVGAASLTELLGGLGGGSTTLEEIQKKMAAEMGKARPAIPAHVLAVLSAARSPDAETAQITLLYVDRAQAEASAPVIRDRLAAFPRAVDAASSGPIGLAFYPQSDGAVIAVLTLSYPRDERRSGPRELSGWITAMQDRRFTVLDPTR